LVTARPGDLFSAEHTSVPDATALLAAIRRWVDRIETELAQRPLNREVRRQQGELEKLAKQFDTLPDDYFTREEARDLRFRLDEFEKQLAAQMRQSAENKRESDAALSSLHVDISQLKERIDVLTKKGWSKFLLVRLARWASDPRNRDLLASGAETVKNLLGPGQ
jgi:hypothetical protein